MKKIFILFTSMFLLVGCVESVAVFGTGAANGKVVQSSLQSGASYGVKKISGKTPLDHAISYVKKDLNQKKDDTCSSFANKKDPKHCLMVEKKIISKQIKTEKKNSFNKPSKKLTSSLQLSINEKSKIKYLD
jgi:hypothetical protein|tara:strand:+ start:111 stop:506 length:396 start_codon:yes stop_codon:yes gene_type:complete